MNAGVTTTTTTVQTVTRRQIGSRTANARVNPGASGVPGIQLSPTNQGFTPPWWSEQKRNDEKLYKAGIDAIDFNIRNAGYNKKYREKHGNKQFLTPTGSNFDPLNDEAGYLDNPPFERIVSDPSVLDDEYLRGVRERVLAGTATASDEAYKNEAFKRGGGK